MRKLNFTLLTVFLITISFALYSQNDVPTVITVTEMGTLGTILDQTQKNTIAIMIVKGEINKADFEVMKKQMPKLRYIDLKDVKCEDDKIPERAFGGTVKDANQDITTIILPESVKTIENEAFRNCFGLAGSLNLPAGLISIGVRAYNGCTGFTGGLTLPDGLMTIGSLAFLGCEQLSDSVIFPAGLTTIGDRPFFRCAGLIYFHFPHTTPLPYHANMLPYDPIVKVPASAVETYKATDGWKDHYILGY